MGKSTLEVWGDLEASQWYDEFYAVLMKSGVIPNCTNDPDGMYPDTKNQTQLYAEIRRAKKACRECPLLDACATYALIAHEKEGIWGGTTPNERAGLRKEIVRQKGVDKFIEKGYLRYFRLRPKVEQMPRESRLINAD